MWYICAAASAQERREDKSQHNTGDSHPRHAWLLSCTADVKMQLQQQRGSLKLSPKHCCFPDQLSYDWLRSIRQPINFTTIGIAGKSDHIYYLVSVVMQQVLQATFGCCCCKNVPADAAITTEMQDAQQQQQQLCLRWAIADLVAGKPATSAILFPITHSGKIAGSTTSIIHPQKTSLEHSTSPSCHYHRHPEQCETANMKYVGK